MSYKVVLIGSNPSQKSGSILPFWYDAKSTAVINKWMEQVHKDDNIELESVHFGNVANIVTPNNRPLKMSEIKAALPRLDKFINVDVVPDKVIALGRTAEKALTLLGIPHYAMPHPSGLNRLLNDPAYVTEKINGLKEYLREPIQNESTESN